MATSVFEPGDIVWVKLSNSWWPGEVWDQNQVPDDLSFLKKKPIAVVKFFKEDSYEYVKNANSIYEYNCPRKNDFIKKGLESKRSSNNTFSDKFREDVITAERLTGGDINIIEKLELSKQPSATKRSNIVKMIFGETSSSNQKKQQLKNNQKSNIGDKSPVINNLRGRSVITVKNIIKPSIPSPSTNSNPTTPSTGTYKCHLCSFTSMRQNVIILHSKSHNNRLSAIVQNDAPVIVIDDDSDSENISRIQTPQTLVTTIETSSDSQIIDVSLSPQESSSSSSSGGKTISPQKILPFRTNSNSDKKKKGRGKSVPSPTSKTNLSEVGENSDTTKNKADHIPLIKPPKKQFRKGILKDIFEDWSDDDTATLQNNGESDMNKDNIKNTANSEITPSTRNSVENLGCSRLDESDVEVLKTLKLSEGNDRIRKSPLTIQKIRNIPKKDRQRNIILEEYSDTPSNVTPKINIILESCEKLPSNAQQNTEMIVDVSDSNLHKDIVSTAEKLHSESMHLTETAGVQNDISESNAKTDNSFTKEAFADGKFLSIEGPVDADEIANKNQSLKEDMFHETFNVEKRNSITDEDVPQNPQNINEKDNDMSKKGTKNINNKVLKANNALQEVNCATDRSSENDQIESPEFEPINDAVKSIVAENKIEEELLTSKIEKQAMEHQNSTKHDPIIRDDTTPPAKEEDSKEKKLTQNNTKLIDSNISCAKEKDPEVENLAEVYPAGIEAGIPSIKDLNIHEGNMTTISLTNVDVNETDIAEETLKDNIEANTLSTLKRNDEEGNSTNAYSTNEITNISSVKARDDEETLAQNSPIDVDTNTLFTKEKSIEKNNLSKDSSNTDGKVLCMNEINIKEKSTIISPANENEGEQKNLTSNHVTNVDMNISSTKENLVEHEHLETNYTPNMDANTLSAKEKETEIENLTSDHSSNQDINDSSTKAKHTENENIRSIFLTNTDTNGSPSEKADIEKENTIVQNDVDQCSKNQTVSQGNENVMFSTTLNDIKESNEFSITEEKSRLEEVTVILAKEDDKLNKNEIDQIGSNQNAGYSKSNIICQKGKNDSYVDGIEGHKKIVNEDSNFKHDLEGIEEKLVEMAKPQGRSKRSIAQISKNVGSKIRKSSRKSDNIYKFLGREITTPSPIIEGNSPIHVQIETSESPEHKECLETVSNEFSMEPSENLITQVSKKEVPENIVEKYFNKDDKSKESIEINEENISDMKNSRKNKKKTKLELPRKNQTDSDKFIEFLENEIKATPLDFNELKNSQENENIQIEYGKTDFISENITQEKPVGRTLRERKIRKEYAEIDEDSLPGSDSIQYSQGVSIEGTKQEAKNEVNKEFEETSPISSNIKSSSKSKKMLSKQFKSTKTQISETGVLAFPEEREVIPKLIIKSSKESGREVTLKVMRVTPNITNTEKVIGEKSSFENELKKITEKHSPKSPKKSPKKSYSKQKSIERKLFRKDPIEPPKIDKVRKDDTPAAIFDFQEEDDTELVLTSLSKLKKKYMSPDKQKDSDLFPSSDIEKRKQIEKEDEKLKVDIENLLNDTKLPDISLSKNVSKTVSQTPTNNNNVQNSTIPDEVKTLPIKERGKRFFKSRNVSRNEEAQSLSNTNTSNSNTIDKAATIGNVFAVQTVPAIKELTDKFPTENKRKQHKETEQTFTCNISEEFSSTKQSKNKSPTEKIENLKKDNPEVKKIPANEKGYILTTNIEIAQTTTINVQGSGLTENVVLNDDEHNLQLNLKQKHRDMTKMKTNELEKNEIAANINNNISPLKLDVLDSVAETSPCVTSETNLLQSDNIGSVSSNEDILSDTNSFTLTNVSSENQEQVCADNKKPLSPHSITKLAENDDKSSGNNITRRRRSHLKVTPRKRNLLEENTEFVKHPEESHYNIVKLEELTVGEEKNLTENDEEKNTNRQRNDEENENIQNQNKIEHIKDKTEETTPNDGNEKLKLFESHINNDSDLRIKNDLIENKMQTETKALISNVVYENSLSQIEVELESVQLHIEQNVMQKTNEKDKLHQIDKNQIIQNNQLNYISDTTKTNILENAEKSVEIKEDKIKNISDNKEITDEEILITPIAAAKNDDLNDEKQEKNSLLNESLSQVQQPISSFEDEKSITEQYENNFVEKYMKDAGMLNLPPSTSQIVPENSAELVNINPESLPDSHVKNVDSVTTNIQISLNNTDKQTENIQNCELSKNLQNELVLNNNSEISLIEQARAIVAKVNSTQSLSDIRSFRPKRKHLSRQSSISVSSENLNVESLSQSEEAQTNAFSQSVVCAGNDSESAISKKMEEKVNELTKSTNSENKESTNILLSNACPDFNILKAVDHLVEVQQSTNPSQLPCKTSTSAGNTRIVVESENPIPTQMANILATGSDHKIISNNEISKQNLSNVTAASTTSFVNKKRKLSIEEDIPTFIIDKSASSNAPVTLNEALKETPIKPLEKPQKICDPNKSGNVKQLLVVPQTSLQEEKEKTILGSEPIHENNEILNSETSLRNIISKESQQSLNENSPNIPTAMAESSTENVFDISTLPILLTTNEELLQDNIQFVITQDPVISHEDRQAVIEQIVAPTAKKIRGRPRKSDPSLSQITGAISGGYNNQLTTNTPTSTKLSLKTGQHTPTFNSNQHSNFPKKQLQGVTSSALSQVSTVENSSQTYDAKATNSREVGVDTSGNSIVLIQYGKSNQKLLQIPEASTDLIQNVTNLDDNKSLTKENVIKASDNSNKQQQQLTQLKHQHPKQSQQPKAKASTQGSGQVILANKGTMVQGSSENVSHTTNVQGNQYMNIGNKPPSSSEVIITPLYESGAVAQKSSHQQLTQITQQPAAQNNKIKKSHLQGTTYVGGENSEVIIRQIQQQQQEQQQQKQTLQMTNTFNQRGRKRKELETPIIPANKNLNTQQRHKQQKLEQTQSQQISQIKLPTHNSVPSSSSNLHYDNAKSQMLTQADLASCAIPNQTQNQPALPQSSLQQNTISQQTAITQQTTISQHSTLPQQTTVPQQTTITQQTAISQQQQHQLQHQQLLQQQQQELQRQQQQQQQHHHQQQQQQQQQKQLLIEEEIAANKIMAVPANHFGIPGSAYYLCSQDNEGNYMPIDNQELYLDPESNQLVPLSVLNTKTTTNVASVDGSALIDSNNQMNLIEGSTDTTAICMDPNKQQNSTDNQTIASNNTSVDNVEAAQQFVQTNNLTAAELSNILSPDQSICINIDGQQLILDQQSFLALVAAGGENTQLETQDGQILQLTGEFLAALGIGVNNNENIISNEGGASCSGGDENSSGAGEQILLQTPNQEITTNTDILASALIDVLQIETSQGVQLVNTGNVGVTEESLGPTFQALTPPVAQTNETNALLTQPPIMSTLEVPSNKKKQPTKQLDNETILLNTISGVSNNGNNDIINSNNVSNDHSNNLVGSDSINLNNNERILATPQNLEDCIAFIGVSTQSSTVPSSLELPITVTNPAIAPPKTTAPLGGLFNAKNLIVESSQISPQLVSSISSDPELQLELFTTSSASSSSAGNNNSNSNNDSNTKSIIQKTTNDDGSAGDNVVACNIEIEKFNESSKQDVVCVESGLSDFTNQSTIGSLSFEDPNR